jgi:protein-tyrosine-phosphatase
VVLFALQGDAVTSAPADVAQGRVVVRSAGSAPTADVNHEAVAVMQELGIGLGQAFPKPLTTEAVQASDVAITMGCGDACPVFPGKRYLDWQLDDPAGQPLDEVRRIRDDIHARVEALLPSSSRSESRWPTAVHLAVACTAPI